MNHRFATWLVGLAGLVVLTVMWSLSRPAPRQRSDGDGSPGATPHVGVPGSDGRAGLIGKDVRTPVAGAKGYFVVVAGDGSRFLEDPNGKRQPLQAVPPPIDSAIEKKVAERLTNPDKSPGAVKPEHLYFLASGVVAVPPGGIVTFVGKDHVVVLEDVGTVVYYTDGRGKEVRERRTKPLP